MGLLIIFCLSQSNPCAQSSSNKTGETARSGVQPPSQADGRSMLQWELCVTEVKIEAQAISGVPSPSSFVFFVFPYSAFPPVTCFPVAQRCLFKAGAVVYDGLTEQFCIYPLPLFPLCPALFPRALGISELCVPLLCDVTDLIWPDMVNASPMREHPGLAWPSYHHTSHTAPRLAGKTVGQYNN